jgi:hypothetical protein
MKHFCSAEQSETPQYCAGADALARLRVLEHRVLSVNLVLRFEVVGVGGGPVAIQGRSDVVVFHLDLSP